jgi:myo-inositol 2-dehydrogenase/D-chiro-inositol 1-dehydrogenase
VSPDVRVGLIGAGVMGADHARTLRDIDGATLVAVSDVDGARAAAMGAPVVGDPLALIDGVDAVLIASPDATHEAYVLTSLAAGKPVLCEKPLAPSAAAAWRIVGAEVALGRRLVSVGFMRRYDPGYVALRQALRVGELGDPRLLHCVHRNVSSPPGFTSSMLITSSAAHEIDTARWLFDDEVVAVTVHRPPRSGDLQDPQFLVLQLASGVLVDVEVFVNAGYGYDVRCELIGSRGRATASGPVAPDWRERFGVAYRHELQDWVDGVRLGEARGATAWDGYAAAAVAQAGVAALESSDSGRAAVERVAKPQLYK